MRPASTSYQRFGVANLISNKLCTRIRETAFEVAAVAERQPVDMGFLAATHDKGEAGLSLVLRATDEPHNSEE
jgi:hypothetical protein